MPREFRLPALGEGVTEAQIIRMLVKEGDEVAEDEYLMEVETDKATVQIPSPCSGTAGKIHVREGDTIIAGDVLVTFEYVIDIRFPKQSMRVIIDASEDKRVIITEVFQKVWAELSRQTLSTIQKHVETKGDT